VKEDNIIELKALHIILKEKIAEYQEKKEFEEGKKNIDLYLCLNPRYYENRITIKQAKLKMDASDIRLSSRFNMFSAM
jgi:hypothetical protein